MKFLVNAQLPRRLARELVAMGHDAIHTLDRPDQNRTGDSVLRALADRDQRIVISKDSDFRDSHWRVGSPRRLLEVTTGNITNADLIQLFELHLGAVLAAFQTADHVELGTAELVVHPRRPS